MTSMIGFPMPKAIEIDESTATDTYCKFTAAPLQTGFGHTLGNALRRVLLSSMEGAATHLKLTKTKPVQSPLLTLFQTELWKFLILTS